MPISSKSRNRILDFPANITINNKNTSLQQELHYNSFLLKNFEDKKFFFKRKIFIDGINELEFVKLQKMLLKLKAEVLLSFDETLDYVIVSKSQYTGLNSTNTSGNQSNIKQNGNLITVNANLTRSRQLQKILNASISNNNNCKLPIPNEQSSHFIAHCQRNNVPILCVSDVWKWITAHYPRITQNEEVVKENKTLDKAKALRVIDDPGFKISDENHSFAPIYKAKSNYMPKYWEEECSIISNKSLAIEKPNETSQTILPSEVTKKCRKSNNLLKPSVENVKIDKKKVEPVKLYCECCRVSFKDTIKHLETPNHLKFANDPLNFQGFGEDFNINTHFKDFLSTRIRKQKVLERIESRKLIKKLSVNDFKSESPTLLLNQSSIPLAVETAHNEGGQLINENEIVVKMFDNKTELERIESIAKEEKTDCERNSKGIEVGKEESENKACEQMVTEEADLQRRNDKRELDGIESIIKEEKILKIVIEKTVEGNLVVNNKGENRDQILISENQPVSIIDGNPMELGGVGSIGKEEKIKKIVIGKKEDGTLVINGNRNEKISNKKVKSISKKRSKLSLKVRKKPNVASHEEFRYESCGNMEPVNACCAAPESDMQYEYFTCQGNQIPLHAPVVIKHQYLMDQNQLQPIEIVIENRAISHQVSYNVVEFDQKFTSFHQFFVPLDVLSIALGQCDRMTIPNFVELHPITVTKLSRAAVTTVVQPQQPTLFPPDVTNLQKVTEERASVSINSNKRATVGIASLVATFRIIDADSEIIAGLPSRNESNASVSSEGDENLSEKLNDSVGSSIDMLSLCRYNINLHSTPESVKTPLSPTVSDSNNLAFSPFILRSAKKACENGRFSPDIEVSPLCRYGRVDSSCFQSDAVSGNPDPILNLKEIINYDQYSSSNSSSSLSLLSSSSLRFDVLSLNNCSLNSKSKPHQPHPYFSVDSLVETRFLEKFHIELKSEKSENCSKQKKPTKRRRPSGFSSSFKDDEDFESLGDFIEIEHKPKRRRKRTNEIISESPLSHRPFRRAKYIARESISISTNLYLN